MRRLAPAAVATAAIVTASPAVAAVPSGSTELVSRPALQPFPAGGVNDAEIDGHGAVSETGRYVVFSSQADGLLPVPSPYWQVFRLDRQTGSVTLVSATPSGAPGRGDSTSATVSGDGRMVAYQSLAQDLVAETTGEADDVFVRDLAAPGTLSKLVSRATDTAQGPGAPANAQSLAGQISADGKSVLFTSDATNLSPNDPDQDGSVYLRRLAFSAQQTVLISRADGAGGAPTTVRAVAGSVSEDGQVATFSTAASSLDPTANDDNGQTDVYARRLSGQTRLVSRADGVSGSVGKGDSYAGMLSEDGSAVAFVSMASNLSPGDANGVSDIYKRVDVFGANPDTTLVSRAAVGTPTAGNGPSTNPAMSRDGLRVAFTSEATNLRTAPDSNGGPDVYVRTGISNSLVTRDASGAPAAGPSAPTVPALSRDGETAVFSSHADGLSGVDDDDFRGVYAAGVAGGPVVHLSRPAGLAGAFEGGVSNAYVASGSVSADGRYVAFSSGSDALSNADDDRFANVFVRDLLTGRTILVSRAGAAGAGANGDSVAPKISADGTRVAFQSAATNLSAADHDKGMDVYVRDLRTGLALLVSRADGASGAKANGEAYNPSIDADGTRVAFGSHATNLGSGADGDSDVFVRDLETGATLLASRADGAGGASANKGAGDLSLSADGTRVAFSSSADNLTAGDVDAMSDVYVRDLAQGRTLLASRADGPDGAKGDGPSSQPNLSGDGSHVAFVTQAANLADGDVSPNPSVHVRDLAAARTHLASRADGPSGASALGLPYAPRLSADGNRVIWGHRPGDLTGESDPDVGQIFLRDIAAGRTMLVSRGDGAAGPGLPAADASPVAALSANGRCVAFTTAPTRGFTSPEYATGDFEQVYLRAVGGTCAPAPPKPPRTDDDGGHEAPDTVAPVISRLTMRRHRFAVGGRPTPIRIARRRTPAGTAFRFVLSERARVRIAIARVLAGRRQAGRCVKPTAALRRAPRCRRLVGAGALVRDVTAGTNRVRFTGRVGRRPLAVGRYRATLAATDAAGNRSLPKRIRFRVRPRAR